MTPLVQLVLARLRSFYREPGAVFWVYGFPLLMVVALGIAFRANPVEKVTVDVQAGPQAEKVRDALITQSTARGLTFDVRIDDEETSRRRLRTGRTDLVVLVSADGSYQYILDRSRAESRLARTAAHGASASRDLRKPCRVTRDASSSGHENGARGCCAGLGR